MTKEQLDRLDYLAAKGSWKLEELAELDRLHKLFYETFRRQKMQQRLATFLWNTGYGDMDKCHAKVEELWGWWQNNCAPLLDNKQDK